MNLVNSREQIRVKHIVALNTPLAGVVGGVAISWLLLPGVLEELLSGKDVDQIGKHNFLKMVLTRVCE